MSMTRLLLPAGIALAAGAAVAAGVDSGTVLSLLTQAVIYAVMAIGVGLLLRQNGMVSFGHALFVGLGTALAGLAGVVAAPFLSLSPSMSSDVIIDSFVVVVVGGLGSLAGAFIAAMVLGMVQAVGAVYLPDAAVLLPFALMVGVLIWKPAGFAGSRT